MLHVALVRIMQIAYDMNTVTYFLNSSLSWWLAIGLICGLVHDSADFDPPCNERI
jgi:hypothetical protein